MTEGREAKEEIWSFLLLWSREKNQLVWPGVVWSRDLKDVLERGRAWFKVSDKTKGPPAESTFLQRAFSCWKLFINPYLSEHHSISVWSWMKICNFVPTGCCLHLSRSCWCGSIASLCGQLYLPVYRDGQNKLQRSCFCFFFLFVLLFFYFFKFKFILIGGELLYNIVLVLPCINMNPPWVYTCSPSWTPAPTSLPWYLQRCNCYKQSC